MNQPQLARADERLIRSLHNRKHRAETGLFIVEGVRIVEEALGAGLVLRLALVTSSLEDSGRGRTLRARLDDSMRVYPVTESVLGRLAATESPQGVLLVAEVPVASMEDLALPARPIVLVLDGVQDPGNFGTLVRSADAFGAAAVIALPGTVDPWNAKAVRAAAGSSFRVPIAQWGPGEALAWLRRRGLAVIAADAGGTPLDQVDLPERVALVVGNEGAGLRAEVRASADEIVAVPTPGRAESLNVAVAAGILLHHIRAADR